MGKDDKWVVEVSDTDDKYGGVRLWVRVAECGDNTTAIAIADAMHSLMQTGLLGHKLFQVRTRIASDGV